MGFLAEHRGPLLGAAGIHASLLLLAALASFTWTREQPPVQLAIQATVVDASSLPGATRKPAKAAQRPAPSPVPAPVPVPVPSPEPRPAPEPATQPAATPPVATPADVDVERVERIRAEEAAAARRAAEREAADAAAKDAAAKAATAKAAQAKAAADKAAVERARAEAVAAEKRRREDLLAKEQAERVQADREAELRQRLLAEEEAEASGAGARQGILDEYRAALVQAIERNWIKPVTARPGLECVLLVDQAQGGTVLGVRVGRCNGDEAVRESIVTAVHRASPLPLPKDPRAFQRRLEIVFKPTE